MAYPNIVSSTGMSSAGKTGTSSVTLPTVYNGNLLVIILLVKHHGVITPPAGWTEKLDTSPGSGTRVGVYSKVSDGTEGGTSVSFSNGAGECKYQVYALSKTTGDIETATNYTYFGTGDPPSISPTWTTDTLYLAAIISSNGNPSAAPSGYSGYSEHENVDGDAAIAYKTGSGTEDPGSFTASSEAWACLTVAIKGAKNLNTLFIGTNI